MTSSPADTFAAPDPGLGGGTLSEPALQNVDSRAENRKRHGAVRAATKATHRPRGLAVVLLCLALAASAGLWMLYDWVSVGLPQLAAIPYLRHESAKPPDPRPRSPFVRLSEISPWAPKALVAAEDRQFYSHFGINPLSLVRALYVDLRAWRIVQGGSTITEQLAKNLLPQNTEPFRKKLQEMVMAVELEHRYSKQQILELYLNKVYFGNGIYGIYNASHFYFGVDPKLLDLYQAATLIGLLPAPSRFNPRRNPALAARRAKVILNDMVDTQTITPALAEATARAARPRPPR